MSYPLQPLNFCMVQHSLGMLLSTFNTVSLADL